MKNYAKKIIDLVLEGKPVNFTTLEIGKDWPQVDYPDGFKPERIQETELELSDEPLDDQERFEKVSELEAIG